MNESATATIPYIPPGHPVRRFVVGIALIAALLGVVWWSGIGRPHLRMEVTETSAEGATIILTNDGPTPVELRSAEFDDPRLDGETIDLPTDALGGGESVEIKLRYTTMCASAPPVRFYIPLRIAARTVLDLDRTVTVDDIAIVGDLVCGTSTEVPTTDVPISDG